MKILHRIPPWRRAGRRIEEHVFLRAGALLTIQGAPGLKLRPGRGQLWITRHGDAVDYFATPTQSYAIADGGSYCVASFAPTLVELRGHDVRPHWGWCIERIEDDRAPQRIAPPPLAQRARAALQDLGLALVELQPLLRRLS